MPSASRIILQKLARRLLFISLGCYNINRNGEDTMSTLGLIILIILILLLIGVLPTWPHSRGWGYMPGGVIGVILVIVLVLLLMGMI